ncbi:RNA chaperone Hfq [Belnapia sp. T18]|uniref:RNA chaperone Hfq n=1 Tax=Belnapia arida TaxID=2804533 RepID=A0ABS1UDX9_9PROT|nr:RNA chaperone Hfq [Belnapia arida]MBL6082164.1 RNA chaperone Hfq [Belnapia arida]
MVDQTATPSVQDLFLRQLLKAKAPVTVFLANGVKLQGTIVAFDRFALALTRSGFTQLVYKHAVSTVMPGSSQDSTAPDASPRRDTRREVPASATRLSLAHRAG